MKAFTLFIVFVASFMAMFFILSLIGLLWEPSYRACIGERNWFALYTIFIGPWLSIWPAREFYLAHRDDLRRVFA